MPTYLCHGFRWHRPSIRVYIAMHDIGDAAPEWIISPKSSPAILSTFYDLYDFLPRPRFAGANANSSSEDGRPSRKRDKPRAHHPLLPALTEDDVAVPPSRIPPSEDGVLKNQWSAVKLLEERDSGDLSRVSRAYAFVADHVVRVELNVSVAEEMAGYEERMAKSPAGERTMTTASSDDFHNGDSRNARKGVRGSKKAKSPGWMENLRDELQQGEEIRWYVVVCGDEDRDVAEADEQGEGREAREGHQECDLENTQHEESRHDSERAAQIASSLQAPPLLPEEDLEACDSKLAVNGERSAGGHSLSPRANPVPTPSSQPPPQAGSTEAAPSPRHTEEEAPTSSHPQTRKTKNEEAASNSKLQRKPRGFKKLLRMRGALS